MKTARLLSLLCSLAAAPFACGQGEAYATIKATTKFLEGGMKSSTIVDPDQRMATETLTDAKDRVVKKTTFLLDEKNFAIGAIHYDAKGLVRYKETFQRDGYGHVVETKFTNAEGQPLGRRVFFFTGDKVRAIDDYDAQGNLIAPARTSTNQTRPDKKR